MARGRGGKGRPRGRGRGRATVGISEPEEDADMREAIRQSLSEVFAISPDGNQCRDFQRALEQSLGESSMNSSDSFAGTYREELTVLDVDSDSDDVIDLTDQEGEDFRFAIPNSVSATNSSSGSMAAAVPLLNNEQIVSRMKRMFEPSLEMHVNGQYMKACQAIVTKLYPHQMNALAWMANRENLEHEELRGGILADDMGLGKTLTVLSLIMTNFHDQKPMERAKYGFQRMKSKSEIRYCPSLRLRRQVKSNVGNRKAYKAGKRDKRPKIDLEDTSLFGRGNEESEKPKKDLKELIFGVKSSKKTAIDEELANIDENLLSDEDKDEFDNLVDSAASLRENLFGMESKKSSTETSKNGNKPPEEFHFNDGLSDDEEYQNMTPEQRDKMMMPSSMVNLDGCNDFPSDEDEEEDIPSGSGYKRKRIASSSSSGNSLPPDVEDNDAEDEIPDFDMIPDLDTVSNYPNEEDVGETGPEKEKNSNENRKIRNVPDLTEEQRKRLIIPTSRPAICGKRRKATLIITPASLISHWIQQIDEHIDERVDLKVFVHHGQCKAILKSELEDNHIVITTYGTLMSEFASAEHSSHSPLLDTKWLRVCLDEGHAIKNFRAKTSKAAAQLNTQRRWIISGTPIQNNLGELWSLLHFLQFEPYCSDRNLFKNHIEHPVKLGNPRGFERLQTLIQAICMRRTKADEVDGKPLVELPNKTVQVRQLEFTKEEKIIYNAYHDKGREVIMRYMKRGTLLKNYAHVFAVMMRLRQLSCHRDLLPVKWHQVNMTELVKLAEAEAAKVMEEPASDEEKREEAAKRLAEQLRDMIKNGVSDDCSICLSDINQPVITFCGHVYCRTCITTVIERSRGEPTFCPLCRQSVHINQLLEAATDNDNEDEDKSADPFDDIVVNVSSTKLNAMMKELEGIRRDYPGEKTVIVSQFTSLLSIVQSLLNDAEFSWTRLDGTMSTTARSKVIGEFQEVGPNSPKVLLLSLRAGGVGLNLTNGSRMILLDPAWNPATEEQCFDRIHRLGQQRDVVITKLVMQESIEQRMLAIQDKKKDLISGAFRQSEEERRQQRIDDILNIFGLNNNNNNAAAAIGAPVPGSSSRL